MLWYLEKKRGGLIGFASEMICRFACRGESPQLDLAQEPLLEISQIFQTSTSNGQQWDFSELKTISGYFLCFCAPLVPR